MSANPERDGGVLAEAAATLADMRVVASDDGQYLLIYCRRRIVAMLGVMGGDVEVFEFADVGRLTAAELVERL